MARRGSGVALLVALTVGIALIAGFIAIRSSYANSERQVETYIVSKERVCESTRDSDGNSQNKCQYLVFTDDGTFKITDSFGIFAPRRTNSSDVYGRIRVEQNAVLTVIGYRSGFMSEYPNILEVKQDGNSNDR